MKNVLFIFSFFIFLLAGPACFAQQDTLVKAEDLSWVPSEQEWLSIDSIATRKLNVIIAPDTSRRVKLIFISTTRNAEGRIVRTTPSSTMWLDSTAAANFLYQVVSFRSAQNANLVYQSYLSLQKSRSTNAFSKAYQRATKISVGAQNFKLYGPQYQGVWTLSGKYPAQSFTVANNAQNTGLTARQNLPLPQGQATRNSGAFLINAKGTEIQMDNYITGTTLVFYIVQIGNEANGNNTVYATADFSAIIQTAITTAK